MAQEESQVGNGAWVIAFGMSSGKWTRQNGRRKIGAGEKATANGESNWRWRKGHCEVGDDTYIVAHGSGPR